MPIHREVVPYCHGRPIPNGLKMLVSMPPLPVNATVWEDYEQKPMVCAADTQSRQAGDDDRQANEAATKKDREEGASSSQETALASKLQASKRAWGSASVTAYNVGEGSTTIVSDVLPLRFLPLSHMNEQCWPVRKRRWSFSKESPLNSRPCMCLTLRLRGPDKEWKA